MFMYFLNTYYMCRLCVSIKEVAYMRDLLCTFTYSVMDICPTSVYKQTVSYLTVYESFLKGDNSGAS